ncbi:MAG: hypothetical protein JW806_02865 [Sedimentisphaerales bacterium]|nr:hypothetical protein [Sedimentisphaerales bacterium]
MRNNTPLEKTANVDSHYRSAVVRERSSLTGYILFLLIILSTLCRVFAVEPSGASLFGADDLYLNGEVIKTFQSPTGENVLIFEDGFELLIGDNKLTSDEAVVWLKSRVTEYLGDVSVEYKISVYLQGKVKVDRGPGAMTSGLDIDETTAEGLEAMVAEFIVAGEIFATAEKRIVEDLRTTQLYRNGLVATGRVKLVPVPAQETPAVVVEAEKPNILERIFPSEPKDQAAGFEPLPVPEPGVPRFQYPVNISAMGTEQVQYAKETLPDGSVVDMILNRFYLWQKQDESGGLLEFQADSAVLFYAQGQGDSSGLAKSSSIKAIYIRGDIIMTEGQRTIRADEIYYDFQKKQCLAVNAVMRHYEPSRGIPIYLRAVKLRQVTENTFHGNDIILSSSEFYIPRLALTASEVVITDRVTVDQRSGRLGPHSYDTLMEDVKLKLDNRTVFYWPRLRGDFVKPDIPLKALEISKDGTFGTSIESEWYLARILGLKEPEGVDSSLMVDYYSKRGTAAGVDITYTKEDYFGGINGYIIKDRGEDDLSRNRQDIEPERGLRGMLNFSHRHFLPYNWQLTLGYSYLSDETYLESFHREQYFAGRGQETYMHLKWLKDNQGVSILGKWRINDFADQLEELPSIQYHLAGKSLFNDRFTLYSNNTLSRLRQRVGENHILNVSNEMFLFGSSRTELDMPIKFGPSAKIVPYIAGTFGHDERNGFNRNSSIGLSTAFGQENIFIGEIGARASTQYWKLYKNMRSKFWDINGLRHIVKPYATAAAFFESDDVVDQRDIFTFGLLQRWQTKRGIGDRERILDWMRLNIEYTMVENESEEPVRADKTIWNNPFVPLGVTLAPGIFNGDLSQYRRFELFGPQRDSINADYIWRISDTMAFLSDFNYDMKNKDIEQYNIGISRLCWPNLSYYVGIRYLRSVEIDNEKGSQALTFSATYKINPRYTLTFANQYDFKRDGRITNQISLIRQYHRLFYGFTYTMDESLDRQTIVFSIWPQGIGEMGTGSRIFESEESEPDRN